MLAQILDLHGTKEVPTTMFHSILSPRLFGAVKSQTFEVLDVTTPPVSDSEMEPLVTEKVDIFWKGIESGANQHGQMIVTSPAKKAKKSWFQVYVSEGEVPWEQWCDVRRHEFNANLASMLLRALNMMLTHTSSERGRTAVPLITNATVISPFRSRLQLKVGGVELG
ncbi:hypothetical protein EDD22DRAFT_778770 [Suillus occidentalis]|nr:hypothetical protein EDD22DRAFT_778792 [Suillus occidentalis]KAG1762125.1 hypothetical protein EDD22DRAFT_778770 [Suillus occidentalis]